MTNFIRRLRAAWFFSRNFPVTQLSNDYWTNQDAQSLSSFLTGETGTKLRRIWFNYINDAAQRAVMERVNARYMCGFAAGVRAMVSETDAHLQIQISLEQSESAQSADGDEAPFQSVNR